MRKSIIAALVLVGLLVSCVVYDILAYEVIGFAVDPSYKQAHAAVRKLHLGMTLAEAEEALSDAPHRAICYDHDGSGSQQVFYYGPRKGERTRAVVIIVNKEDGKDVVTNYGVVGPKEPYMYHSFDYCPLVY